MGDPGHLLCQAFSAQIELTLKLSGQRRSVQLVEPGESLAHVRRDPPGDDNHRHCHEQRERHENFGPKIHEFIDSLIHWLIA
jgi:hypothetical protein